MAAAVTNTILAFKQVALEAVMNGLTGIQINLSAISCPRSTPKSTSLFKASMMNLTL